LKKLIFLLVIGLTVLVAMPFQAGASPLAYTTARIAGQDRIETALSIAQKGWTTAQTVILCEGADYPDSIAAAPFAASLDAPILLTGGQSLDPRVVSELQRLKPQKVFLLGGSGRLTSAVEAGLNSLSLSWERIGGETRYETSVLLAGRLNSESVIIANGDNFPDALSAASYAGMQQIPIVLVSKTLPACVDGYVKNKQPKHVVVIGGEGAVPTDMLTKSGITVETRLGGQDRFATNAKVVTYMQNAVQADDLFLASGLTFPDAVAGTVLASKYKAPLLLTEKDDIPSAVYTVMREHMKVEPPTATTSYGQGKITAAGGLNLRGTPSTSGTVLVTVPEGATVEIAAQQGQWYKATYQNKSGWLSASYVTITATYKQGKITAAGGLNMRESSATTARILTTIPQNALVTVTNEQNGWYKVTYQGTTGWIYADYVTVQSTGDGSGQAEGIDLSPNGKVYIFGGLGVISATAQNIIEGKAASQYPENLQDFPPLPASLNPLLLPAMTRPRK
jgi:N-acetylmuramoyl-L-alanine amidase